MDERFRHPFMCVEAGPTNSLKSSVWQSLFSIITKRWHLCRKESLVLTCGDWHHCFYSIPNVEFI